MIPFNIVSRDFSVTEAIQSEIEGHVSRLEQVCGRITSCDVVLSLPHKRLHKGRIFHLVVKVHVPGDTLVVNREPEMNADHEDFHLAARDAFGAMKRCLVAYVSRQKGKVKMKAKIYGGGSEEAAG